MPPGCKSCVSADFPLVSLSLSLLQPPRLCFNVHALCLAPASAVVSLRLRLRMMISWRSAPTQLTVLRSVEAADLTTQSSTTHANVKHDNVRLRCP